MLELTKEQMEAIQKAISKKAEESVQEFDKELDVVVSKLSTEGSGISLLTFLSMHFYK